MNTLDTLAVTVSPIESASLDQIDGGLVPVIIAFLIGFGLGFGGAAAADW